MESDTLSIVMIAGCIMLSAYFSATETAFSSLNRIRVKNMADKGDEKAALVLRIAANYDSMLSTLDSRKRDEDTTSRIAANP